MTPVVPVFHPRGEARRAVKRGFPRRAAAVRLCPTLDGVARLLAERLVDAVVVDVKAAADEVFAWPARFRGIPFFALSAFRPEDLGLVARCRSAGFAGVLVEGVDNAVAGEWVAARGAGAARRAALAEAPRLLRLSEPLQLAAWEEVLARGPGASTGQVARALRVSREHLSREFAAGGAPNLKRVLDLVRVACAAELVRGPGYTARAVAGILGFASSSHLTAAARRVAGVGTAELAGLGARGVLQRFARGRTRSRV